jgi:hypothetical protein
MKGVADGMLCYLSSCRKELNGQYVERNGQKYCQDQCFQKTTSQVLQRQRESEIAQFRASGLSIPTDWTNTFVQGKVADYCQQEPLKSLLHPSSTGSFYIYFGLNTSIIEEGTKWLTERSSGTRISPARSRPQLRNQDGSLISPAQLYASGWQTQVIESGGNPLNYSRLEKALHVYTMDTLGLEFGRRLHRKRGGATWKPDDIERQFAVAITYNILGYLPYKLIQ